MVDNNEGDLYMYTSISKLKSQYVDPTTLFDLGRRRMLTTWMKVSVISMK